MRACSDPESDARSIAELVSADPMITAELLRTIETVVLNVRSDNPPALAAYRALGYREVTRFEERLVHRETSLWDSIVGPVRALVSDLRRNG